jgi:hypothetical protein
MSPDLDPCDISIRGYLPRIKHPTETHTVATFSRQYSNVHFLQQGRKTHRTYFTLRAVFRVYTPILNATIMMFLQIILIV